MTALIAKALASHLTINYIFKSRMKSARAIVNKNFSLSKAVYYCFVYFQVLCIPITEVKGEAIPEKILMSLL